MARGWNYPQRQRTPGRLKRSCNPRGWLASENSGGADEFAAKVPLRPTRIACMPLGYFYRTAPST